jgi:endonuclease YncB( thermonuclease family)
MAKLHPPPPATVIHVADGDTIDVQFSDGSVETVRLLDVNTPETIKPNAQVECYGPEASAHTQPRLCGNATGDQCSGTWVPLDLAHSTGSGQAERNRYGRLLGYSQ